MKRANKKLTAKYQAYANVADSISELAELVGGGMNMPKYPRKGKGDTFETTSSKGGYGDHTGGSYHLRPLNPWSGFKPYGTLGQGPKTNKSVTLKDRDQATYMAITVAEVGTRYLLGSQHSDDVSQPDPIKIKLGAYAWDTDAFLTTPSLPVERFIPQVFSAADLFGQDNAKTIMVSSIAATVVTLFV